MAARAIWSLAVVAAAALAACGERREPGGRAAHTVPVPVAAPAAATTAAVATVDVSLVEYRLEPANPRVSRHGVIAFVATNDGQTRHALAVDGPTREIRSPTLRPGERATIRLNLEPGTYTWYCPIADHERRGMTGRVRIAE